MPLDVLHIAATIANKMVMPNAFGVEARGAALNGHFAHQPRLHQITKIVVGRGARRARVQAIHGVKDFRRRGMTVVFH